MNGISIGAILLITGWVLVAVSSVMLLRYRLLLRHYDRRLLKMAPDDPNPLHSALQNRMTLIDRWGASLTAGIILYTALFLVYVLYESYERIMQTLHRVFSLV